MRSGGKETESETVRPTCRMMRLEPQLCCILGQVPHLPERISEQAEAGSYRPLINHVEEENASGPIWGLLEGIHLSEEHTESSFSVYWNQRLDKHPVRSRSGHHTSLT